jgi:hypothetical protein
VSAARVPAGATGEPLYDVVNDRGEVLMASVTGSAASHAMATHQAALEVHPQWQGEIRVLLVRHDIRRFKRRVSIECDHKRLNVRCDIQHFVSSGMTVAELFARVRPQLVAAVKDAAARYDGQRPARRCVSVEMDMGGADPDISLLVGDPVACLADMDNQLDRLQRIAERVIATERAGGAV